MIIQENEKLINMDEEQLLDYEEEQDETTEQQNKVDTANNDGGAGAAAKKIKVTEILQLCSLSRDSIFVWTAWYSDILFYLNTSNQFTINAR